MQLSAGLKNLLANKKVLIALCTILLSGLALWLWMGRSGGEVEWVELNVPAGGKAGFTLLSPEQTGITFINRLKDEQATANQLLMDGSGVAAGDFDNDGLCDLYFCRLDGWSQCAL
jgi:hypothetical protein